ncbi:potassium-transporting ATPase subunit beta-like [Erpetoichthys calabaricus]|uniref:Sodium/potassium-transporting ATPase subunit beta n=1 Tax=Erpetoichthys calabaricus TaxID=27687 RepID=A0A8C4RH57_ERPCA|nr:potassium-transporting ATPase subunit beta-like [Erpetoichthys calabaricus]
MAALKEKRTCAQRCEDFGYFVWNPDTKQLLGRTLDKWVYISLYYVAFYIVMSGLFVLALYVLLSTLSPYTPTYRDRLQSPGVVMRPNTYGDEGLLIVYEVNKPDSYTPLIHTLQNYLTPYNRTEQHAHYENEHCNGNKYFTQNEPKDPEQKLLSCPFYRSSLGKCSGMDNSTFGYPDGQPCIIIKMNRIIKFFPSGKGSPPPYVNCSMLKGEPKNLHNIEYFPPNGTFDLHYFPYYGKIAQPSYMNPLVAVKFNSLEKNKLLKIECRVVADKISADNIHDPYEGKVEFEIEIKNGTAVNK